jgi:hypothetical protein
VKRRALGVAGAVMAACAVLAAADFWATKPFMEWSDKEVDKIMNDSPWSAVTSVALPPVLMPSGDIATGGRGAPPGGDGGGRGDFTAPFRIKLTISWRSALPVKQGLARGRLGLNATVPPEAEEFLTREETSYVIALFGLPPQYGMAAQAAKDATVLRRDGKPDIHAGELTAERTQVGLVLVATFPRTDPIALEDKDVEFVTKLNDLEVKKKFKLKDMVFKGKLEL